MDNYKVKVNSESESKEVQELFFELGYGFNNGINKIISDFEYVNTFYMFAYKGDCDLTHSCDFNLFSKKPHTEITIPQLKDLVVLKRNDVADATHMHSNQPILKLETMDYKCWSGGAWHDYLGSYRNLTESIKPIIKETVMTEYLDKDYMLRKVKITSGDNRVPDGWIEIPDGSDTAVSYEDGLITFYKDSMRVFSNIFTDFEWENADYNSSHGTVIWKREKADVEDKKIDTDEILADIEVQMATHSQHSHYFKDVRDLNVIDVYQVLKLFNVTDPCLQHIVKKALAAGNRGHKSLHTDMKDIHDTAVRMLAMHGIV